MTEVTQENYYSPEMQMAYMGSTQYKAFQKCEAAALAELRGEYNSPVTSALLIGGYVDAFFSGEWYAYMERDRLYMLLMSGQKQVIRTGFIAGVPFKIRIDSLLDADTCERIVFEFPQAAKAMGLCDGAIVDQKVVRDFLPVWSEEAHERVSFVEAWGYDIQGAIYQEIEGNMLPFIIAAGTKEDSPDLGAFYVPDDVLREKLAEIEDNAPRYQAIKEGRIQPRRCGRCAYCRATNELTGIYPYNDISEDTEVLF